MGLFDNFRQSGKMAQNSVTLGPAEAFVAIVLIVVAADGYLANDEIILLNTVLRRMQMYRSYSVDVMQRMFDKLSGILRREGSEVLFNAAIANLPHDLYDTTFAIATDLVLADGNVSPEEEAILGSLSRALEIPEATVSKIIEVMLIKNKG
ncbi:MAG: tellurite resistance TerB family protein [Oscillatoria sp. PMC 1068.18]|nr:tellurite resistance TerB family protein [Oscillatoria sp. PMC 1076.18]MEC4990427.1 tellurite resistance TerB family protein [Oscillatoria sp. PMC 1068.18]